MIKSNWYHAIPLPKVPKEKTSVHFMQKSMIHPFLKMKEKKFLKIEFWRTCKIDIILKDFTPRGTEYSVVLRSPETNWATFLDLVIRLTRISCL